MHSSYTTANSFYRHERGTAEEAAMNTTNSSSPSAGSWLITSMLRAFKRVAQQPTGGIESNVGAVGSTANNHTNNNSNANNHRFTVFHYFISPYSGVCMIMAIVLNRTAVFASSRRHNPRAPRWPKWILRLFALSMILRCLWFVVVQFAYIYHPFHDMMLDYLPEERQPVHSLLWSVFMTLCISQFLETFVSITSGQSPSNDTGLTLFEHSIAFQECQRMKIPSPHLLIICCFSLITQLTTHTVGLLGLKKYQLIPSTILGISFLLFYCLTIYYGELEYMPSVVLGSVFPQLFVLVTTTFCVALYELSVLMNGGDASTLTYTPMMENLKDSLNLQLNDDFNSALMRFGYIMFTAVEDKQYVNELPALTLSKGTYLEQHHLVSGYLNKLENNPDLVELKQTKPSSQDIPFYRNWNLYKKFANMAKLLQALLLLAIQLIRHKPNPTTKKLPTPQLYGNLRHSNDSTSCLLDDSLQLEDVDTSEDFIPNESEDEESEVDPLEYDSELDELEMDQEYVPTLAKARLRQRVIHQTEKASTLNELFTPDDIVHWISPNTQDTEEMSLIHTMRLHLSQDRRLTRRQYGELNRDGLLEEVIQCARHNHNANDIDDHEHTSEELTCVVCQTEPRSVVLWPCKCFSLCEGCRMSLGIRGFGICVCCRAKVEGYSKIFIP